MMAGHASLDMAAFEGLRGKLSFHADMQRYTWFRTGGPAALLFKAADVDDLQSFVRQLNGALPVMPIGVGSNLLVRDGGIDAAVVVLGRAFADVTVDGDVLSVGAGAQDVAVARAAQRAGIAGLEFLSGIPGTIGGAVAMNAGAYGAEICDVLIDATIVDAAGKVKLLTPEDLAFEYRKATLPDEAIVVSARLKGRPGDPAAIAARIKEIVDARENSQPIRSRTGGSTFKNPPGQKAWQLVDAAGCRGLMIGGAQVSQQHCNFLINTGDATAADLEELGEEVRRRVEQNSGVVLQWEIKRVGRASLS